MTEVYLDHAAATPLDPRVLEAMSPYFSQIFGNPDSKHNQAQLARQAVEQARQTIATHLNCNSSEIIFTSGGTEANNLAILGTARHNVQKGRHLITSKIEHSSVIECFRQLEKEGFEVTWLEVDHEGLIPLENLKAALRPDTLLVSIMHGNNEIGTVFPIAEIGDICRANNTLFHTDACQTAGTFTLNTKTLQADLLTINAAKIYGPKGVGALYVKNGVKLQPTQHGGGQERRLRSGTLNVPGIVGLGKALDLVQTEREKENQRLTILRQKLITGLTSEIPDCTLNGPVTNRLPNNINLSIRGLHSADLVLQLNELGIYVSAGSACHTTTSTPSHVLESINLPRPLRHSAIRLTLGHSTTEENIDYVLSALPSLVEKMRKNT